VELEIFDLFGKYDYSKFADTKTIIVTRDSESRSIVGFDQPRVTVDMEAGVAQIGINRRGGFGDKLSCIYKLIEINASEESEIIDTGSFEIGHFQTKLIRNFAIKPRKNEKSTADIYLHQSLAVVLTELEGEDTRARISRLNVCRI